MYVCMRGKRDSVKRKKRKGQISTDNTLKYERQEKGNEEERNEKNESERENGPGISETQLWIHIHFYKCL